MDQRNYAFKEPADASLKPKEILIDDFYKIVMLLDRPGCWNRLSMLGQKKLTDEESKHPPIHHLVLRFFTTFNVLFKNKIKSRV